MYKEKMHTKTVDFRKRERHPATVLPAARTAPQGGRLSPQAAVEKNAVELLDPSTSKSSLLLPPLDSFFHLESFTVLAVSCGF